MDTEDYDVLELEMRRLLKELEGYMKVSLHDGTDSLGRLYAYKALVDLNKRIDGEIVSDKHDARISEIGEGVVKDDQSKRSS
jgi:hypothetical protein